MSRSHQLLLQTRRSKTFAASDCSILAKAGKKFAQILPSPTKVRSGPREPSFGRSVRCRCRASRVGFVDDCVDALAVHEEGIALCTNHTTTTDASTLTFLHVQHRDHYLTSATFDSSGLDRLVAPPIDFRCPRSTRLLLRFARRTTGLGGGGVVESNRPTRRTASPPSGSLAQYFGIGRDSNKYSSSLEAVLDFFVDTTQHYNTRSQHTL